jgi:hypothetical protein
VAALNDMLDAPTPSSRAFVGNSAGALAAALFGVLAGADEVVWFEPLASLNRLHRLRSHDRRWSDLARSALRSHGDRDHLDRLRLLRSTGRSGRITVNNGVLDPPPGPAGSGVQE